MKPAILIRFLPMVALAIFIVFSNAIFVVDETQQAIVTRLGEYKPTLQKPRLKPKNPLLFAGIDLNCLPSSQL